MPPKADEPVRRRRGLRLEEEIREAVFAELADVGYSRLTMQGVARRAGTGKAPLYRRWANKDELILAVLAHRPPGLDDEPVDTGELRCDLIALLTQMSTAMAQPVGRALFALIVELIGERPRNPALVKQVIDTVQEPRLDAIMTALRRAARRGEIRPGAATELLARVGPALIIHQQLHDGRLPTPAEIADIVDTVIIPALGAAPRQPA